MYEYYFVLYLQQIRDLINVTHIFNVRNVKDNNNINLKKWKCKTSKQRFVHSTYMCHVDGSPQESRTPFCVFVDCLFYLQTSFIEV